MPSERLSISSESHYKDMSFTMNSLLESEDLVDVTLAVGGRYLKAHKLILSVCSPYFRDLFKTTSCKHPIVFMKDISYNVMSDLLQFMYQGEVQVSQASFNVFMKTAESLQIRGLSHYDNQVLVKRSVESSSKDAESKKTQVRVFQDLVQRETDGSSPAPKRFRSIEQSPTLEIVKNEPMEMNMDLDTNAPHSQEMIILKSEHCEPEELSVGQDDNFIENMCDESQDDTNVSEHDFEDCIEIEGGYQGQQSVKERLEGSAPSELGPEKSLPEKSKSLYMKVYAEYKDWCLKKEYAETSEKVLLEYFQEQSSKKKPSTLWAAYSMLKSTISLMDNIDITQYCKLIAFIKRQNASYKPRKSSVFSKEEITKFLTEAPDDYFLSTKAIFIFGIAGACRTEELCNMHVKDVNVKDDIIIVNIPDTKTVTSRKFVIMEPLWVKIVKKYLTNRPTPEMPKVFIGYRCGKFTRQNIGHNTISNTPHRVAKFLKLQNPKNYTGHSLRRTSAIWAESSGNISPFKRHGGWKPPVQAQGCIQKSIATSNPTECGAPIPSTSTWPVYSVSTDIMDHLL